MLLLFGDLLVCLLWLYCFVFYLLIVFGCYYFVLFALVWVGGLFNAGLLVSMVWYLFVFVIWLLVLVCLLYLLYFGTF